VQALSTAAYPEALKDLERGLALVESLPPSQEQASRALGMTTALASVHITTRGFGAPESRGSLLKARQLCEQVGRDIPLEVLGGIFGAALISADRDEVEAVMPYFRELSERTDNPLLAFSGHQVISVHALWSGRIEAAWAHGSRCMELYRREAVRGVAWEFGFGIHCYAYAMLAAWHRGFPDEAEAIRAEMMERAEQNGNPHCVAVALGWSTTLTRELGKVEETIALATRLIRLAEEQHLPIWAVYATNAQGSALAQGGQPGEGVELIERSIATLDAIGARCNSVYYLVYLADAYLRAGRPDEALRTADRGIAMSADLWTRLPEAEHVRLRAAALQQLGRGEEARLEALRAIEIAERDGSRAFADRARALLA
jgi:tetratricopeptide (TPR) repeat protein